VTEDLSQLERRLEQATASDGASDGPLDAETASLREGWLALTERLKAVQPAAASPLVWREPRRSRRYEGRRALAVIAVAASLVMGVAVAGRMVRTDRVGPVAAFSAPSAGSAELAARASTTDPVQPGAPSDQRGETEQVPTVRDWDDPLDQQIAAAGDEIAGVHRDWDHLDDALGTLYYGLDQVERDLEESSL
jgi:hypothetical protein